MYELSNIKENYFLIIHNIPKMHYRYIKKICFRIYNIQLDFHLLTVQFTYNLTYNVHKKFLRKAHNISQIYLNMYNKYEVTQWRRVLQSGRKTT